MYIDSSHGELISALKWAGGNRDHGGYTTKIFLQGDEIPKIYIIHLSPISVSPFLIKV